MITEMEIFNPEAILPDNNTYVLVHLNKDNWIDADDPKCLRYWRVVKFVQRKIPADLGVLPGGNESKTRWFHWEEFDPGTYSGQEVDMWCHLPEDASFSS